jgi:hypothetical protein
VAFSAFTFAYISDLFAAVASVLYAFSYIYSCLCFLCLSFVISLSCFILKMQLSNTAECCIFNSKFSLISLYFLFLSLYRSHEDNLFPFLIPISIPINSSSASNTDIPFQYFVWSCCLLFKSHSHVFYCPSFRSAPPCRPSLAKPPPRPTPSAR